MKNYLPEYGRKKGEPLHFSRMRLSREKLPKVDQQKIDEFIKKCQITMTSKATLYTAQTIAVMFLEVVEKPLSKVKLEDVEHFVSLINNSGKSREGRIKIFFLLKKFLALNFKDKAFIEAVKNKKETGKGTFIKKADLITPQELEAMLRIANTLKEKALLTLLYESAGRPDEILNLKWKDIVINDDNLAEIALFSGKKKELRHIVVKDCVVHLQRWKREYSFPDISPNDYAFIGDNREQPLRRESLLKIVKRLAFKAGIKRSVYPYLFRHTRLTFMRQKLKPAHYTQFAGHTERQAANYTHLDLDDLREALLSEVYVTEELSPEQKSKLEQEMEKIKKEFQNKEKEYYEMFANLKKEVESLRKQRILQN